MEENKNEEVVEETTEKQPKDKETKSNVTKVKAKMKKPAEAIEQDVIKVDLSKKTETDAAQEQSTDEVPVRDESETSEEVQQEDVKETDEKPTEEEKVEEVSLLEEVVSEESIEQSESDTVKVNKESKELPENIKKLMDFMSETGGDINDYVKLNQNYDDLDNHSLLKEYYKQTKPHLNDEEIDFLMEDTFSFDEEIDEEKEVKRKKLALKEQVASAKAYLDGRKSKYYEEIKAGSKLTSEQQKAIDFFNRYNKESEEVRKTAKHQNNTFQRKTNEVFNDDFKGFEYNVGKKRYRFNVKDVDKVRETQGDVNNLFKKFLDNNNQMSDARGYHKSMFTAMNPDTIANHFYEQGRADALKESAAKSKNVNMTPRQSHGEVQAGGVKVKILGDNSSDFKFKIKNNK
jgi:hypothetical protein